MFASRLIRATARKMVGTGSGKFAAIQFAAQPRIPIVGAGACRFQSAVSGDDDELHLPAGLADAVAEHLEHGRHDFAYRTAAADEIMGELLADLNTQGFDLIDDGFDDGEDGVDMNLVRLERTAPSDKFPYALGVAFDLDEAVIVDDVEEDDEHDDFGPLEEAPDAGPDADGANPPDDDEDDAGGAGGGVSVQQPLTLYVAPQGAPLATAEDRARALVVEAFTTADDDLQVVRFGAGAGSTAYGGSDVRAPELEYEDLPVDLRESILQFLVDECGFGQDVVTYANGRAALHAEKKYLRWCEGVDAFLSQGEQDS